MLGIQQPFEACFLELRRVERIFDPDAIGEDNLPRSFNTFDIHPLRHLIDDDVPVSDDDDLFVLPQLQV